MTYFHPALISFIQILARRNHMKTIMKCIILFTFIVLPILCIRNLSKRAAACRKNWQCNCTRERGGNVDQPCEFTYFLYSIYNS